MTQRPEEAAGLVSRETPEPTTGELAAYFADRFEAVAGLHELLLAEGEVRGLVGPREAERLWSRHLLNSAGLSPLVGENQSVIDVGSGAGFPGLVVAAMRPDVEVVLLEPMQRRTDWLEYAAAELGLDNVRVERGRAEDSPSRAQIVTSRAVAALGKLLRWSVPLLAPGGEILAIKGRKAADEVVAARSVVRKLRLEEPEIVKVQTLAGLPPTIIVRTKRVVTAYPRA